MKNIILNTDSYKMSHFLGYPEGIEEMYSYLESRGGRYEEIPFVGLAPILETLAAGVTMDDVEDARNFAEKHGVPFNYEGWSDIVNIHEGKLPIEIKALPEGTIVSPSVPMLTIRNTDKNFAWLTSYLETMLLRIWYPMTVAARIRVMKNNLREYYKKTTESGNVSPFAILDFSSRGVSSLEQSEIGGMAYLMLFEGSDNVPAVDFVNRLYGVEMSGFSVPATEHSIMCSFGQENELESFEYLIDNMAQDGGIISVVSDSWNIYGAVLKWATLEEKLAARNITLVIRPDSGEIDDVLPKVLQLAIDNFEYTINDKGFAVFDNIKILWGDGIDEYTGYLPFDIAMEMGISADSIMTGSGGGLMQKDIDRDTCKFAVKGSNVIVKGKSTPISKSPITDKGKSSKSGKFVVYQGPDSIEWGDENTPEDNLLEQVFLDGEIKRRQTLSEVRDLIENGS